jgi:GNAT superfamily N-acetyltransferase
MIESKAQWWIFDEFCSMLDRDTAKIVAFNVQKLARKLGCAVLAATTHNNLFEDLQPSVHIHKRFGKEIKVDYYPNEINKQCSLVNEMRVEEGSVADYRRLSVFHYRTSHCPAPRKIFVLKRHNELCGVIVYSWPPPNTFGRSKVWKGSFQQMQKELSTITRVVVHPKYRTIGLGIKLVKETLPLAPTPCVETIAVMARYNSFFERGGMQKVAESKPNPNVLGAIEKLRRLSFNPIMLGSVDYNMQKIKEVGREKMESVLIEFCSKEGALRKRLLSFHRIYPRQAEAEAKKSNQPQPSFWQESSKDLAFWPKQKFTYFGAQLDNAYHEPKIKGRWMFSSFRLFYFFNTLIVSLPSNGIPATSPVITRVTLSLFPVSSL